LEKSRRALLPWIAVIGWAAVLFGLSSIPGSDLPTTSIPSADKWVHICLYGVFGLLCFRAVSGSFALTVRKALVTSVLMVLLYGISDEVHQVWVPRRSPDPMDVAADVTGGIAGALLAAWRFTRSRAGVTRDETSTSL
jgi:VanZ family protein